jgi:hypothetical protein
MLNLHRGNFPMGGYDCKCGEVYTELLFPLWDAMLTQHYCAGTPHLDAGVFDFKSAPTSPETTAFHGFSSAMPTMGNSLSAVDLLAMSGALVNTGTHTPANTTTFMGQLGLDDNLMGECRGHLSPPLRLCIWINALLTCFLATFCMLFACIPAKHVS